MKTATVRRYSLGIVALLAGTTLAVNEWRGNPPAPAEAHAPDPHAAPAAPAATTPTKTAAPAKPVTAPPPATTKPITAPPATAVKPAPKVPATPAKSAEAAAEPEAISNPDEALKLLQEGNQHWIAGQTQDPNTSDARRKAVATAGQKPFAAILTCADSRVPVEHVFDRGVGDLFVMRVAGNITGDHEAGSIEYGAEHLHVPLLVVMGHTQCGAVAAAASHTKAPGNVASLITAIDPAVTRAERLNPSLTGPDLAAASVKENVWQSIFDLLKTSDVCREKVAKGELKIVGAVYDIASGKVEWMGEHPWQSELIAAFTPEGASRETVASGAASGAAATATEPHASEH